MGRNGTDTAWDTLSAYANVVRRRWWVVAAVTVALPLLALGATRLQGRVYQASAEVLVSRENLAATLVGVPSTAIDTDPVRFMQTQAGLARTTDVARRTLRSTNPTDLTIGEFMDASSVVGKPDSDLLVFSVDSPFPGASISLANGYARSYTLYRNALETAPIRRALQTVTQNLDALRRADKADSALYAALLDKQQQLRTIEALKTDSATVVQPATEATQVRPRTLQAVELALVFGLAGGLALALVLEAADRRLRSPDDLTERLKLATLGRIPDLGSERLPTITQPGGAPAEAYRILRMNIDFAMSDRQIRTLMVTSAMEDEGKSTTAANLAITFARAGRSVILVDADFLQPTQATLLAIPPTPGLVQVARRHASLVQALTPIRIPTSVAGDRATVFGRSQRGSQIVPLPGRTSTPTEANGSLRVLATEGAPLDSTEEIVDTELQTILEQLETECDLVIIDAPPLGTSITLWLGSLVDAMLLVANPQMLREAMVDEIERTFALTPCEKLGIVLNSVEGFPGHGYAYKWPAEHEAASVDAKAAMDARDRRWA